MQTLKVINGHSLKKVAACSLLASAALFGLTLKTDAVTYELRGVVDEVVWHPSGLFNVLHPSITVGSSYVGRISFDPPGVSQLGWSPGEYRGFDLGTPFFIDPLYNEMSYSLTLGGIDSWEADDPSSAEIITIVNDGALGDSFSYQGGTDVAAGWLTLSLIDPTGNALDSWSLPNNLHQGNWSTAEWFLELGDTAAGRITSIRRVPETGNTAFMLGMATFPILLLMGFKKQVAKVRGWTERPRSNGVENQGWIEA